MDTPDLLITCIISFATVLILLSLLAAIMRLILIIFPAKEDDNDASLVAAITASYNNRFPGTKIIKIGEQK